MKMNGATHTQPLSHYRLARDSDANGRITREEELDRVSLGSSPLEGDLLQGLYLRKAGMMGDIFGSWKPAGDLGVVAAGIEGPVIVTEKVAKIDPQAGLVTFQQVAEWPQPSKQTMIL